MASLLRSNGPRVFIAIFLAVMVGAAVWQHISLAGLLNDALVRLFMNGVLVLSLIPMMRAGAGINYGMPVGILCGLLGMVIALQYGLKGASGLIAAIILGMGIAIAAGWVYAGILNRVRGREEVAGIFCGFSAVYAMCFFWNAGPIDNPALTWPIGGVGLRLSIGLEGNIGGIIDNFWLLQAGGLELPLGALLLFASLGLVLWLFFRSRPGMAIDAVGENPVFASLNGISIDGTRTLAIIISTCLAALGICIYAQSYGFLQLYEAPLMMAFPAASAILLGGSATRQAGILQAIIGTFLFQSVYIVSGPLANNLLVPELSEIVRTILTSGVILYALLQESWEA